MNTSAMTNEQRLEAFKMCMAEAGFPVPEATVDGAGRLYCGSIRLHERPDFWRAAYRAYSLVVPGSNIFDRWCEAHYVEMRVRDGFMYEPVCPCHSGTSGYPGGGES